MGDGVGGQLANEAADSVLAATEQQAADDKAGRLRSVQAHRREVLALMRPTEVVTVELAEGLGLAVAREVASPISTPPFDNSAMDGFAVRAMDLASVPAVLAVTGDIAAGSAASKPLMLGTTHRIMTGAPIPSGADAVVRVEWTDAGTNDSGATDPAGSIVRVNRSVEVGTAIRRKGGDVHVGQVVAAVGDEITPARLGLLASVGIARVAAHRAVRVAVLSTGDELHPLGRPLPPGGIYDSNSYLIAAAVRAAGAQVVVAASMTDDVAAAQSVLERSAVQVDLVITTGGISAGAYEVVKQALAHKPEVTFHSLAVRPGRPQGLGMIGQTPVVALPGNPVSALVSFELFARPAIRALGGHINLDRPMWSMALGEVVQRLPDRCSYLLGRCEPGSGIAYPTDRTESHLLSALAVANCLIVVPQGDEEIDVGDPIDVVPIGFGSLQELSSIPSR